MTPAIDFAKEHALSYRIHEYTHDPSAESYGLEAAEKLGISPDSVYKTLVVADDKGKLAVGILPVNHTLNLKRLAKALGVKKVNLADPRVVERSTGYILGGVSPLAQKRHLPTIIDENARALSHIYVSAGRRGLEIELPPTELAEVLQATFANIV